MTLAAPLAAQSMVSDHAVEQFGTPPTVPDGPLSQDLQDAIDVAFVQSMQQQSHTHDNWIKQGQEETTAKLKMDQFLMTMKEMRLPVKMNLTHLHC